MSMRSLLTLLTFTLFIAVFGCRSKSSEENTGHNGHASKQMADGKVWLTENLKINMDSTYCQKNEDRLCAQFGRLYTWQTAKKACESLGGGWRLPTDNEWRTMAKFYGGIYD